MPRIIWLRGLCKPSQQVQALIDLIGAGDQWQRKTPYHDLYHVYYYPFLTHLSLLSARFAVQIQWFSCWGRLFRFVIHRFVQRVEHIKARNGQPWVSIKPGVRYAVLSMFHSVILRGGAMGWVGPAWCFRLKQREEEGTVAMPYGHAEQVSWDRLRRWSLAGGDRPQCLPTGQRTTGEAADRGKTGSPEPTPTWWVGKLKWLWLRSSAQRTRKQCQFQRGWQRIHRKCQKAASGKIGNCEPDP